MLIAGLTGLTFSGQTETQIGQELGSVCGKVASSTTKSEPVKLAITKVKKLKPLTEKNKGQTDEHSFFFRTLSNTNNCLQETSLVPSGNIPATLVSPTPDQNLEPKASEDAGESPTVSERIDFGPLAIKKTVAVPIPLLPESPLVKYSPSNPMPKELVTVLENPFAYPSGAIGSKAKLPEMNPNEYLVFENGEKVNPSSQLKDAREGYLLVGDGWSINLQAVDSSGSAIKLNFNGQIVLNNYRYMEVQGEGFAAGSLVKLWLLSDPKLLGKITVDPTGRFTSRGVLPEQLVAGPHTLQVNGLSESGQIRSVSFGLVVETEPFGSSGGSEAMTWWLLLLAIGVGYFLLFQSRQQNPEDREPESVGILDLFPDASWK
jgi:hypothetical protein